MVVLESTFIHMHFTEPLKPSWLGEQCWAFAFVLAWLFRRGGGDVSRSIHDEHPTLNLRHGLSTVLMNLNNSIGQTILVRILSICLGTMDKISPGIALTGLANFSTCQLCILVIGSSFRQTTYYSILDLTNECASMGMTGWASDMYSSVILGYSIPSF